MNHERLVSGPAGLLSLFVVGAAVSAAASIFLSGALLGVLGVTDRVTAMVLTSAVLSAALLLLSQQLFRREGATLGELGLVATGARARELGFGFAVSAVLFLGVVAVQSAVVGADWTFKGNAGLRAGVVGLAASAILALTEELLFRGAALRYLRAIYGDRSAIVLSALLFGAWHLIGSQQWAMGAALQFLMPALGGLLFGWAAVRSNGLALPLGLHIGGNWVIASLAGFAPVAAAPSSSVHAVWQIPISTADVQLLTAPDMAVRLPNLLALVFAALATRAVFRARAAQRGR